MSSDAPSSTSQAPPFLVEGAFVEAPEHAEEYEAPEPTALEERARRLLTERLGDRAAPVVTGYACGTVGVQADQTHYSDGFGLLMALQQGIAVAVRKAEDPRILFAEGESPWTVDASDPPPWVTAVRRVLHEILADQPVDVTVVSTIPGVCRDGYYAALTVALMRAVRHLDVSTAIDVESVRGLRDELVPLLAGEIGAVTGRPYSTAYLLATFAGRQPAFTLVDTTTREHLPVETDARSELNWAVFDPGGGEPRSSAFHRRRQKEAEQALRSLRSGGFEGLDAFRDLEHRDLERALEVLPSALRPIARHLVTENRRVQKHVAAMRRSDWQMVGALLLMSHASQRDDWEATHAAADVVVDEAETHTHDGIYGACMTGRSGAILVTGRPRAFQRGLRHISDKVASRLGHAPRILRP